MGITQIISGLADLIHRWERIKIYWPHLILIVLVFILHIQEWWVSYDMRNYEYWRLPTFLFIILYPVNLYILARILFPVSWRGKEIDLKKFYFQNFRRIYLLTICLDVLGIIDNIFIGGFQLHDQIVQFLVLSILVFVAIRGNTSEVIHKVIATALLLISVVTFILTWNIFLINSK
jgi:hypothetical protein